jgi:tetratricopeptide (TPR) repeat protein
LGDQDQVVGLLCDLGSMLDDQGSRPEAEHLYDEASTIARDRGDLLTNWAVLTSLGLLAAELHPEEAETWHQRALESARAGGNPVAESITQCNLGLLFEGVGEFEPAREHFEESLVMVRSLRFGYAVGIILNDLGLLALKAGDLDTAERDLTEALPLLAGTDGRQMRVRGNLMILAGLVAQRRGDRDATIQAFQEALRWFEQAVGRLSARDSARYVRELLADLREQSPVEATPLASKPATASTLPEASAPPVAEPSTVELAASASTLSTIAPRMKRRWWPWRR